MNTPKADKRVSVLFYLLVSYIFLQFIWWAYMLIDLNLDLYANSPSAIKNNKVIMIVGEGSVFFIFLIAGLYITRKAIRKELSLVRQQRNFLLSITHELKTPIAAIKLCLETMSKHLDLSKEKRIGLEKNALRNTTRLNELIENVLLATRIESGEETLDSKEIDLSALSERIIERFSENPGFVIHDNIQPKINAKIDSSAYDSILSNLIENALKYSENKPVSIELKQSNSSVELKVLDEGPGISESEIKSIFEKFYRIQNEETRSQKGTGLGLYIVKRLVDLHQGSITVKPNSPKGSVFVVMLPI